MTKQEYYMEVLEESLDEVGAPMALTKDQLLVIADNIATSAELESQAFYVPCGGQSVKDSEIAELKRKLEMQEKETDDWKEAFRKNVSMRYGDYDQRDIAIDKSGKATLERYSL